LTSFPRWDRVDRSQPFWAVRQYATTYAADDFTNPLTHRTVISIPHDPQAIGAIVEASDTRLSVRYYSGSEETLATVERQMKEGAAHLGASAIELDKAGGLELQWILPSNSSVVMLLALGWLGHGILI
jgi:hypothetical protein